MPTEPAKSEETPQESRYIVGIDLGTTNSAVGYVDTEDDTWRVEPFPIAQLVDSGQVESLESLPSFHYQVAERELSADALRLPWHADKKTTSHAVGVFAREQGTRSPGRLIVSAKSWLCHSGVDRTADLLPWHGAADVDRLSPVAASSRYLRHIRQAWDHRFPSFPLAAQDVILTLPASFDEVARELTVEAAALAGLRRVVLIEEPQAAFYAWIDAHDRDWEQLVEPGQKILVCDIGGGTSDFTLIRVRRGDQDKVQFHRVAVGEHLILGGDNLDLALAKHLESELGGKLQPHQWDVLVRTCRRIKEELLDSSASGKLSFNLPGSGSKLIGGGLRVEVERDQARQVLLDGFFPLVELDEKPNQQQSGFREFGLPYAADAAVTRYLAAFLTAHRHAGQDANDQPNEGGTDPARPDIVLFNGGVFSSSTIRQRVIDTLKRWFAKDDIHWSPQVLENVRLDLAVAKGAAYYGTVRRGRGVKITAGLARSYYIGIDGETPRAVCLVPGNAEPGQDIEMPDRRFRLLVHQPVEFPLYISSTRLDDQAGELLPVDNEQMKTLPPIRTALKTRGKKQAGSIDVTLHARLTEIGTLDLWCAQVGTDRRWRLQFDVRSATQTDIDAHSGSGESEGFVDESLWDDCQAILTSTFGEDGREKPDGLPKRLAAALESPRHQWPMSLLRRIWESLMDLQSGRRKSALHESRWLNLLGYSLRPGFGMAVDDWRVAETWRAVQGKLVHGTPNTRTEMWILWRRIAGGLSSGQQRSLADPLLSQVRGLHRRATTGKGGGDLGMTPQQSAEMWRLLGSLELLDGRAKTDLGNILVDIMNKKSMAPVRRAIVWSIGRVGSRTPFHGPLNTVAPVESARNWLDKLLRNREPEDTDKLAVMQIARMTGDRYRDLPEKTRGEVARWLQDHAAPDHFVQLVLDGGELDQEEQGKVFGESLPTGLRVLANN